MPILFVTNTLFQSNIKATLSSSTSKEPKYEIAAYDMNFLEFIPHNTGTRRLFSNFMVL